MSKRFFFSIVLVLLAACSSRTAQYQANPYRTAPQPTPGATATYSPQESKIPVFDHVIMIALENRDYGQVIGSRDMPVFNQLAKENVLLTQYYAVAHPSLPNYIALVGGDTYGITSDCTTCFIDQPSLPDLIEASGRTWKTYQEDLPAPCFVGNAGDYMQKHNPFIYFDPIRNNPERCQKSIVSLQALDADLASNQLPNFAFITPNKCNSAHNCSVKMADQWLGQMVEKLRSSNALGQNYLIYISFEEGSSDDASCCGLSKQAGGRVAAVLISPQAKSGYQEETPLSHYSLLKTILISWQLPELGYTASPATQAITGAWK